jgi:hypothetical protein
MSFWIGFQKLQLDYSLFLWTGDEAGFHIWVSLFLVRLKQPGRTEMPEKLTLVRGECPMILSG